MKEIMLFGTGIKSKEMIDLRSDVVTKPSKDMLRFMINAKVGNDGWKEDPTVNKFERMVAKLFGKEKALITPSGTMANEIAIRLLCPMGSELIVERESHIFNYEVSGPAALSGVQILPLRGKRGVLKWEDILPNIRPKFHQFPKTCCISLEHPHNNGGGKIYPLDIIKNISNEARKRGINMHLDGSRLFNACVEKGISPKDYGKYFDLINICLSKSLGCPGGSVLIGSNDLIEKALIVRRQFGGSMRQISGYMAACGIYALNNNVDRLKEDNKNAKSLADTIKTCKKLRLVYEPETNIVVFRHKIMSPEKICHILKKEKILIAPYNYPYLRAVFHLDVCDIDRINKTFTKLFY
jgi:threonine aldolase